MKIINNLIAFARANEGAMDRALNRMAMDIELLAKEQVPFDKGPLKASGTHLKIGTLNWQVLFNKVYALFQHEGGDGKRVVRHYSKAGKKKYYLKDPGMMIAKRATKYFKEEARAIKV